MKWETSNGRPASESGMSSKSKLCSPGSGYQGVSSDVIPGRSSDIGKKSYSKIGKSFNNSFVLFLIYYNFIFLPFRRHFGPTQCKGIE